jgi:myo-inositol-1(or 4)-monophosphatase
MKCNDTRRWGSAALELCLMAKGVVELYFEMRLQPWDYAAGEVILTEAGGCIATFDGGAPSLYAPSMVVAANCRESLEELLRTVHRHMDALPY